MIANMINNFRISPGDTFICVHKLHNRFVSTPMYSLREKYLNTEFRDYYHSKVLLTEKKHDPEPTMGDGYVKHAEIVSSKGRKM